MREITSYFGEIIVIVAVSGLLFAAAPEGKLKKYIKFIISVSLTAALSVPLLSLGAALPRVLRQSAAKEASAPVKETENAVVSASEKELETAFAALVAQKYGLDREKIRCEVTLDAEDTERIEIRTVRLFLPPCDKAAIAEFLRELLLNQSEIVIEEGL